MIPWELLDSARTPDGTLLKLSRRGDEYAIRVNGKDLMTSRTHGSEEALATHGCARALTLERPCVLVGGLGMGFTLRATLDLLPPHASVVVSELLPAVVRWNQGPLAPLAGRPLDDRRVRVEIGDVMLTLRASSGRFDAVLLDVDNGPAALTQGSNARLYGSTGLAATRDALRPGGVLALWSAREDRDFERRLRRLGLAVETVRVRARGEQGGPWHTLFVACRSASPRGG